MAFIGDRQRGWFKELVDAGVVPAETVRMVVDIGLDDVVRVYYETLADEAIFKVGLLERGGIEAISINEARSHSDIACDLDAAKCE